MQLQRRTLTALNRTKKLAAEQACITLLESAATLTTLFNVHAFIIKAGLLHNPLVLTKFTSTSSLLHATDYAFSVLFSPHSHPHLYDAFLFNTLIKSYSSSNSAYKSIWVFNLMRYYAVLPNNFTYPFLLKACCRAMDLTLGCSVHGSALKLGFCDDLKVQNTLVRMYCCAETGVVCARKMFDEMCVRDCVSWNAMIGGYARVGRGSDAVGLFRKMQIEDVRPDAATVVSVLSACSDLGALKLGKWVESFIEKERVEKNLEVCNALIDMFAKCGDVGKAVGLFRSMRERDVFSWTSVIVGYAMHGLGEEAVELFEEMRACGVAPDDVTLIGLLSACSHSGLVDKGKHYFDLMRKDFGVSPRIEHYGCMVDMLCRAGLVKEALEFVKQMPIEPNFVVWRILINVCRVHGEYQLGETITRQLIRNEPAIDSNYVLLSNIYAKMSNWEKKTSIREMMERKGVRKVPGSTMIELDNELYEFVSGDKSHKQNKEIYEMVDEMSREMRKAGYEHTTSEVLLDIDDEDKEDALNRHSEKLAIAFGLLNTVPGTPIRLVKNLRVCDDCHSATKFISKIYNLEIIVRDRNQFHHFNNRVCSCRDYW